MIWLIPRLLAACALYAARFVSWLFLPHKTHAGIWERDLCRYWMHSDGEPEQDWSGLGWWWTCSHCGRRRFFSPFVMSPPPPPPQLPPTPENG